MQYFITVYSIPLCSDHKSFAPHQRHVCALKGLLFRGDSQEMGVEELDEQGNVRGDAWMKKLLGIEILQKQLGKLSSPKTFDQSR